MIKTLPLYCKLIAFAMMLCTAAFAQTGSVKGIVWEDETNDVVVGANVILKGTTTGTISNADGSFELNDVPAGSQVILISFIGYGSREIPVKVPVGGTADLGRIKLETQSIGLEEISVIASVAIDRKTPVAVSTVKGPAIEAKVGNQEFPEMLRNTPSVYVTKQGGGFGDSRINVRGFDQRNTAVMINGVPVNDMENGWVYWSNWAGLSDVTSSMQVQRGLGASKLAVSSVGGSINIVTNAAQMEKGGSASVSFGNDGYMKYGLMYSTGLSEKGWAFTVQGTRTSGSMYSDGTEFSAWSYFASIAKEINSKHSLHFTAVGAPQWHHQREYGAFDGITYDTIQARGIKFNPQWGLKNGDEFSWRKNFYHKPKVFLNHYWTINEKTELATSVYASFGRGGGTGDLGRINDRFRTDARFRKRADDGTVRWDDIVSWNQGGTVSDFDRTVTQGGVVVQELEEKQPWSKGGGFDGQYVGTERYTRVAGLYTDLGEGGFIRRASMNSHNWYGILSTLTHRFNDQFTFTGGLDARYYKGIHYRRLEDLLGLDAYMDTENRNNPVNYVTDEGSDDNKIDYYNDGLVKWIGVFGQLEYSIGSLSAFVSGSYSNQSFKRIDYFFDKENPDNNPDDKEYETGWEAFSGGTVKAGLNYNINSNHNVFFNAGRFSQQPIFDNIFLNNTNTVNANAENQKVTSFELGYGYRSSYASVNVNLYNTTWDDRQVSRTVEIDSQDGTANFYNIAQIHQGVEIDASASPIPNLTLTGMVSVGNWRYKNDFTARVTDGNQQFIGEYTLYMDGVKVPDAAQTAFSLGAEYEIIRGLRVYGNYYFADNVYADFNISTDQSFNNPTQPDGSENQAWKLPSYSLVDGGVSYAFKLGGLLMTARLNVNNVLDEEYIAESETNILFDPNTETKKIGDNGSTRNIVYYGFGRTWNAGLKIRF